MCFKEVGEGEGVILGRKEKWFEIVMRKNRDIYYIIFRFNGMWDMGEKKKRLLFKRRSYILVRVRLRNVYRRLRI